MPLLALGCVCGCGASAGGFAGGSSSGSRRCFAALAMVVGLNVRKPAFGLALHLRIEANIAGAVPARA
jgi:hypothetical protein